MSAHCPKFLPLAAFTVAVGSLPAQFFNTSRTFGSGTSLAGAVHASTDTPHPWSTNKLRLDAGFLDAPAVEVNANARAQQWSGPFLPLATFSCTIRMNGTTRDSASILGSGTLSRLKTVVNVLPGVGKMRTLQVLGGAQVQVGTNYSATASFSGSAEFRPDFVSVEDNVLQLNAVGMSTLLWSTANQVASLQSQLNYGTHRSLVDGNYYVGRMEWTFGVTVLHEHAVMQNGSIAQLALVLFVQQNGLKKWINAEG